MDCLPIATGGGKSLEGSTTPNNHEARGHTLVHLLENLQEFLDVPLDLWPKARELDRHYIQSRYPNGFDSVYPAEFYDQETAGKALANAEEILDYVSKRME